MSSHLDYERPVPRPDRRGSGRAASIGWWVVALAVGGVVWWLTFVVITVIFFSLPTSRPTAFVSWIVAILVPAALAGLATWGVLRGPIRGR